MGYLMAILISIGCWVFWGMADPISLGEDQTLLALQSSIACFVVLGLIQMIGRGFIGSRRTVLNPYRVKLKEIPAFVINDALLVEDQLKASGVNPVSEEQAAAGQKTDFEAKRLSEILED